MRGYGVEDVLDALQAQAEALARKNGRMAFAHELAQWAVKNREQLPPELREELAQMIVRAGE